MRYYSKQKRNEEAVKLFDMPNYYLKRTFWYLKHRPRGMGHFHLMISLQFYSLFKRSNANWPECQHRLWRQRQCNEENAFNFKIRFHLISSQAGSFYVLHYYLKIIKKKLGKSNEWRFELVKHGEEWKAIPWQKSFQ